MSKLLDAAGKKLRREYRPTDFPYGATSETDWRRCGIDSLIHARNIFGVQFEPQQFDWVEGSNLANYGITESVFHLFRCKVDALQKEITGLKQEAEAKMGSTPMHPHYQSRIESK